MANQREAVLCPRCLKREECRNPCPALELELSRQSRYLRELPVSPEMLERLAEKAAEAGWGWNSNSGEDEVARPGLSRRELGRVLTRRQAQVVELVIWEGLSLRQAAQRLGIHRSAACRRYLNALARLRRSLTSAPSRIEGAED